MGMPLVDKLVYAGMVPEQATIIAELLQGHKPENGEEKSFDVSKVGLADASTNAEAIKLVNALKDRLNEVIEALRE